MGVVGRARPRLKISRPLGQAVPAFQAGRAAFGRVGTGKNGVQLVPKPAAPADDNYAARPGPGMTERDAGLRGCFRSGEMKCPEELAKAAKTFSGTPLVANLVEDGKTPMLTPEALQQMGYKIALYPISALLAASAALEQVYAKLLGTQAEPRGRVTFSQYNEIVGLPDFLATAKRFDAQ